MEQIKYRKTLDVHKNGVQFMLQGFETADKLSRVIEISLMASGDAIDFPLEKVEALMYVTTPNATEPSINSCTIEDNKIVYNVLPIVEEGITEMQLKIISASTDGARGVLASPKFSVEVTKSGADDESAEQTTTFTALEEAMAKAKTVYDERFLRMELTEDCTFKAYYADGTVYETDILKRLFNNGNVLLSESYAHGGTGVRAGEDTDNSKYYSNVSKSEALNAKHIMENSEEILVDVRKRGMYTAFSVNFESGEVEYVSTSSEFIVDKESGELEATDQKYSFEEEVFRVVDKWIESKGNSLDELNETVNGYTERISTLETDSADLTEKAEILSTRITPIELGGTGASTKEESKNNLIGLWNLDENVGSICFNRFEKEFSVYDKEYVGYECSFPLIHSGKVQLKVYNSFVGYDEFDEEKCSLSVYQNEKVILEAPYGSAEGNKTFDIDVTKGETIKTVIKVKRRKATGSAYVKFNLSLWANIETPYKYIDLLVTENKYLINEE